MKLNEPKFFISKYERHIIASKDFINSQTTEQILDLLLDFGFRTALELVRFDNDEQNLVEFIQDIGVEYEQNFEVDGRDCYH